MIHEDITISGSFQASGSFILPRIPSNSLATATTGSMFYDTVNDVVKIYTGTGSTTDGYITVGVQSAPSTTVAASPQDIEYVLIAGGGGGGSNSNSGGGGAGGYKSSSLDDVTSGSSFTITVGAGGTVSGNTNGGNGNASSIAGSTITTISTVGGGGGSKQGGSAGAGGSGGGGAYDTSGAAGTAGQGFAGGSGVQGGDYPGGGGGGASEAGNTDGNGAGGDGKASSITDTSVTRAGGGSGGVSTGASATSPGDGGGGVGARGNTAIAQPGDSNTGGGGGGGGADNYGKAGGSGVAIFSYPTSSITAVGGVKTTRSDGQFVHTFKSSGTLKVGGPTFHTTAPGDHFNTVLYTGTDASHAITGVGFQPDFVWIKRRNSSESHAIYDSTRGINKQLSSDQSIAEATNSSPYEGFTSFDSDGFTVDNNGGTNRAPNTYVAWCWKANGGTTSAGSGTNVSSVLNQANTAGGFSISTFTGAASAAGTFTHGLGSTPEFYIVKTRNNSDSWFIYHKDLHGTPEDYAVRFTTAAPQDNVGFWNDTAPTSTHISLGNGVLVNSWTYVAYAFKSIDGYQKFGTYTGDGSTGQSITTGFRPGFVLLKSTVGTDNWRLYDTTRGLSDGGYLEPNNSDADNTSNAPSLTMTDTGFEIAAGGVSNGDNASGNAYIYWAIAN